MSTNGPERRIEKIERALPPPPCKTCRGQTWHVVMGNEPMPPETCPTCGRALSVLHIVA
jgi:hypothetical protein